MEPEPASGTLIFLFTDVEGSTRLWERSPQAMRTVLERHDRILQEAVAASGGQAVNGANPKPWFQRAFDLTRRLDARMSQLRAAVRLCRLPSNRDAGTATAQLGAVYDTFTEGFTTADLTEARALLEARPS